LQVFGGAFGSADGSAGDWLNPTRCRCALFYQTNGFLDAKVEQQIEDNYKGKEGDLFIPFCGAGREADTRGVASIEGNHAFKEDQLLGVVASTSGSRILIST